MKTVTKLSCLAALCLVNSALVYADPTIVNNYNNPAPSAPQDAGGPGPYGDNTPPPQNNGGPNIPPGSYQIQHGDGTGENVYTTGTKNPYIVEQYTNQNATVQPYIGGGYAPSPEPGPAPGPLRR